MANSLESDPGISIDDAAAEEGYVEVETSIWGIKKKYTLPNDKSFFFAHHHVPPSGLLPPAVRYMSPNKKWVVVERPPQEMVLNFYPAIQSMISSYTMRQFVLPIPWTIYATRLNNSGFPGDSYLFARNRAIESDADELYILPLPNCYEDGRMCVPELNSDHYLQPPNLGESINILHDKIWSSNFNLDLNAAMGRLGTINSELTKAYETGNVVSMLKRWEQATFKEVLNWTWPKVYDYENFSLKDLIRMGTNLPSYTSYEMFSQLHLRVSSYVQS